MKYFILGLGLALFQNANAVESDYQDCMLEVHNLYESIAHDNNQLEPYEYRVTKKGAMFVLKSADQKSITFFNLKGSRVHQGKGEVSPMLKKSSTNVMDEMLTALSKELPKNEALKRDLKLAFKTCNQAKDAPPKVIGKIDEIRAKISNQGIATVGKVGGGSR